MQWRFQLSIFLNRNTTLQLFTKRNGVGWGDTIDGGFWQRTGKSEIAAEFRTLEILEADENVWSMAKRIIPTLNWPDEFEF